MSTRARSNARVVLDTNVVLSGIFFGGVPGRILDAWQVGHLTLVLSPAILVTLSLVISNSISISVPIMPSMTT